MAQTFKAKTLLAASGRFSHEAIAPNLIYNTGDQNISGIKNFYSRPTVNGTGVLLSGEAANITLPNTIVYTTGNQIISGNKTFLNNLQVSGTSIFQDINIINLNELVISGAKIIIGGDSGVYSYTNIYISGNPVLTGVLPTIQSISNVVYTTGNQTISGNKNFAENVVVGDQAQNDILIIFDNKITFGVYPTINGTGIVYTEGDQTISGTAYSKAFALKETDSFRAHTHDLGSRVNATAFGTGIVAGSNSPTVNGNNNPTESTGGTETRPANIALLYCIKF